MTLIARALLGAAIASTLTLLISPFSRSYIWPNYSPVPKGYFENLPGQIPNVKQLDEPTDEVSASFWMETASSVLANHHQLSNQELSDALQIALSTANEFPENAYWHQMAAVLYYNKGDRNNAVDQFRRAALCRTWSDLQSIRLRMMRDALSNQFGSQQAWQSARVYWIRSMTPVRAIIEVSNKLLEGDSVDSKTGRLIRYSLLRNADLIRENARSLTVGYLACGLTESCISPEGVVAKGGTRKQILFRDAYIHGLRKDGYPDQASSASEMFQRLDTWSALAAAPQAHFNVLALSYFTMVTSSVAGSFLICAVLGLVVWVLAFLLEHLQLRYPKINIPYYVLLSIIPVLCIPVINKLPVLVLAITLCAATAALSPARTRSRFDGDTGLVFTWVARVVALLTMALLSVYLILGTTAATMVLDGMNLSDDQADSRELLFFFGLLLVAVLFFSAAVWSHIKRVNPARVLLKGLQSFGACMGVVGLTVGVIACPLAIYADRKVGTTLNQMVSNEPYHYFLNR